MAVTPADLVRRLRELIAALDRRAPRIASPSEATIVRDAAELRSRAVSRLEELEEQAASAPGARAVAVDRYP
ncbi:MAG: hypothetical protein AB7N65_17380 [Vicinamibacterales bacterium]